MSRPSGDLFLQSQDATVKFDYFICTAAGALFAYVGQSYSPHKFNCFSACIEPLAILLFAASFWCGLQRAKKQIYIVQRNQKMLEYKENAGDMAKKLEAEEANIDAKQDMTLLVNGQALTIPQFNGLLNQHLQESEKIRVELGADVKHSNTLASRRDRFLFAGFCVLLAARIAQPYITNPAPPAAPISVTANIPAQSFPATNSPGTAATAKPYP